MARLSPTHTNLRQLWADDYIVAAPTLAKVVPGNEAGGLIQFNLNPSQQQLGQTVREVHAFRLIEQVKHFDQAAQRVAWETLWGGRHKAPLDPTFSQAFETALDFGPLKAMRLIREKTGHRIVDAVRLLLGKARQFGGTTLLCWIAAIRSALIEMHKTLIVAHKGMYANDIASKISLFFNAWPPEHNWLHPGVAQDRDGLFVLKNGSQITVDTAGGKDIRSPKFDLLLLSEYAHYDTVAAVNAIFTAALDHCWILKESTARGMAGQFYRDWTKAGYVRDLVAAYDAGGPPEDWNGYFRCFIDWLSDPRYVAPTTEVESDRILSNLDDYEQALRAKDERFTPQRIKWRRQKILTMQDPVLLPEQFFAQEFPANDVEMFQSTGVRPFSPQRLDLAVVGAKKASETATWLRIGHQGDPLRVPTAAANAAIWVPPAKVAKYVIGADPAVGGGLGDRSWAVVLERVDGAARRQVAEWRGRVPAVQFGHILTLLAEWYNNAFVVCEITGPAGLATITTMVDTLGYYNLYRRKDLGRFRPSEGEDYSYGFTTGQASKRAAIEELIYSFESGLLDVKSEPLLAEMREFMQDEKGRFTAPPGLHDDGVMALAFANFGDSVLRGAPPLRSQAEAEQAARALVGRPGDRGPDGLLPEERQEARLVAAMLADSKASAEMASRPAGSTKWWTR